MSRCCAGAAFCAAATVASFAGAGTGEAPVWNETTLVSRQSASAGGAGGTGGSSKAAISANGRYIAFASDSDNLSDIDNDGFSNVFVRDTRAGETTLVSRQSAGEGGAGADAVSFNASISADGRYVAFASDADNLSASDSDAQLGVDVFVRDLEAHTTTLVSRQGAGQGGAGGDEFSNFPSISADGRYVTFVSDADNLSTADVEEVVDVFVRDLQSNTTTLVSRQSGSGGAGADDVSSFPAISPDGRYVAFQSSADNLSTADDNAVRNIFVRDTQSNTTTLVSRQSGAGGAGADGASSEAAISAGGRYVAFQSDADNLSAADDNRFTNLFVRDLQSSTATLVSRQSAGQGGAPADGVSGFPAISADGRYVAFQSDAENLSGGDAVVRDVFVRDLDANETSLVSRQSAKAGGVGGDGSSFLAAISPDGRYVAFDSGADNLDPASDDVFTNVFVSGRSDPPDLDLSGKKSQKLGKPVKVRVSCDELCSVTATGLVKPKGKANRHGKRAKRLELTEADAELEPDERKALKLSPSRRVARKLQRSAKASVKIAVTAADLAGNSTQARLKIKLR
jgi:Tol biopolymer transport system component